MFNRSSPYPSSGTDAFQEADTLGITRSCTKHNFLVKSVDKLQRTIYQGYQIAKSGRPGPVVIDLLKMYKMMKLCMQQIFKTFIKKMS